MHSTVDGQQARAIARGLADAGIRASAPDWRPAVVLEKVSSASLDHVRLAGAGPAHLVLREVSDLSLRNCPGKNDLQRRHVKRKNI